MWRNGQFSFPYPKNFCFFWSWPFIKNTCTQNLPAMELRCPIKLFRWPTHPLIWSKCQKLYSRGVTSKVYFSALAPRQLPIINKINMEHVLKKLKSILSMSLWTSILRSILFQDRSGWAGTKPEKFSFVFHITETHLELSIQSVILPCSPNSPPVGKQLHSWITDFLYPRRQRVDFNGMLSSLPVMLQCPHTSVLDPVLFLIFINDLRLSLNNPI